MTDTCPLCGGDLEDHGVTDEREEQIRDMHDITGNEVHATVCSQCGHVSYHTD